MEEKNPRISDGTAAILVCDESLKSNDALFFTWLREEGFHSWGHHGNYGCWWVYVNLESKLFAPGMPGIPITHPIGRHAITISEFYTIYSIFKQYEGKEVFVFHNERFDYERSQ